MRRAVLFLALAAAGLAGMAASQTRRAPDAEALAEAAAEADDAARRSRLYELRAANARSTAEQALARNEALAARIEAAEARLTEAEARIRMIARLTLQQRARIARRQAPAARLTAALQTMARRPPALALIQPGSMDDAIHVRSVLAATIPEIRRRTEGLRRDLERIEALAREAAEARAALNATKEDLRRRQIALARFEAAQRGRFERLSGLAMAESDKALALSEEARALERMIGSRGYKAALEARLMQLPPPLPRPGGAGPAPAGGNPLPYRLPVEGRVVTGVGEISESGVHARGITIAPVPRARVISPAAGNVIHAAPFRSYGLIVIIDHGRGWSTVIAGLSSLDVAEGQRIASGAILGRAGRSGGEVTIELRRNGLPVPVTDYLAG